MQTSGLHKSQQMFSEPWYRERLCSQRLNSRSSARVFGSQLAICPGLGRQCRDLSAETAQLSPTSSFGKFFCPLSETEMALAAAELPSLPLGRPADD